jgi:hypothetical protein
MSARHDVTAAPVQWNYWAVLLGAALAATLAPWYLGVIDLDLRPTLRALLTGGALALALMQLDLARRGPLAAAAPHFLGVAVLAASWYLLGTFDVTGFLILFAVPTYAAALECGRWTVLGIAATTVVAAVIAAALASPALRWQLQQFEALAALLPRAGGSDFEALRFASSTVGREQLATLAVFAVAILAVAGIGASAAGIINRQARTLRSTDRAHRESASLASKLLDDSAEMQALVSAAGRVHSMNRTFREALAGAKRDGSLIEALQPVYPEPLEQLLAAEQGGSIASQACRPADKPWLIDIAVEPVMLDGESLRRVRIGRTHAADLAAASLDALELAVAILGPDKTVAFASDAFRSRFTRLREGATAAEALEGVHGLPAHWWDIAPSRTGQVRFVDDGRRCLARIALTGARPDCALTSIELKCEDAA